MKIDQKDIDHAASVTEAAVDPDPAPKPPDEKKDDHALKAPPISPEEPLPGGKDDI